MKPDCSGVWLMIATLRSEGLIGLIGLMRPITIAAMEIAATRNAALLRFPCAEVTHDSNANIYRWRATRGRCPVRRFRAGAAQGTRRLRRADSRRCEASGQRPDGGAWHRHARRGA